MLVSHDHVEIKRELLITLETYHSLNIKLYVTFGLLKA